MCNLYSLTKGQAAIRDWFRARHDRTGKLSDHNARAAGLPWIREEDYPVLIAIFKDGYMLPRLWKEWEQKAKEGENMLKAQGYIIERAYIDPDTFADWCASEGVGTGRDGRMKFAAKLAAEKQPCLELFAAVRRVRGVGRIARAAIRTASCSGRRS
jgi:hypothetical protein